MNGNDILIYQNGVPIASTRSNSVQTNAEIIPISSPTSGQWEDGIPGRKNWSVNTSFLVSEAADISALLHVGDIVTLQFRNRSCSACLQGQAIVQTCEIDATRGNLAQGSFVFVGKGELANVGPYTSSSL